MKTKTSILLLALAIGLASCSSDAEQVPSVPKTTHPLSCISVVKLADYLDLADTRAAEAVDEDRYVLRFENELVYNNAVNELQNMELAERMQYFHGLGYVTAEYALQTADDELDMIFDIEDDTQFLEAYNQFKNKYQDSFVYNGEDQYDLSPYLPFSDEDLQIVGDLSGLVIVGDAVKSPSIRNPTFEQFVNDEDFVHVGNGVYVEREISTRGAVHENYSSLNGRFHGISGASFMIKQGKYQSTMSLYYTTKIDGNKLVVRYASQKKKKLWKRRHKTTYTGRYNGKLILCPRAYSKWFGLAGERPNRNFTGKFTEFSSGCCSGVKGSHTFYVDINKLIR